MIPSTTLMGSALLLVAIGRFTSPQAVRAAQQQFDLGGPCSPILYPAPSRQIEEAKRNRSWDRVVELEKESVRNDCDIEYRWRELGTALVEADRQQEALLALQEMDSRGFDLSPSTFGQEHEQLKKFMESPLFKASQLGMRFEQLRKISDERRISYRELLKKLSPNQKPADNYVAKNVCPFECCQYGKWSVLEDTDLVAAPGSKRVVGRARKGSRADGLTGEVHLTPKPVVVVGGGDLPKDSIAFVLDYGGEGFGHVYTQGKIVSVFLGYAEYCFRPSESCWGETLLPPNGSREQVWWVKVRLANGTVGWTDKPDNFGDKDACGG
jgi:hypothetical protein